MSLFDRFLTVRDILNGNPTGQQQRALFEAMSLMCEDGVDADELPSGKGEFGMTPSNPIPCKTMIGSSVYLGRLRTSDGTHVAYQRLGAVASEACLHPVDVYELSSPDGQKLATLFLSPYQKRVSRKTPRGFKLADDSSRSRGDEDVGAAPPQRRGSASAWRRWRSPLAVTHSEA
jgi:hypothetical protein